MTRALTDGVRAWSGPRAEQDAGVLALARPIIIRAQEPANRLVMPVPASNP